MQRFTKERTNEQSANLFDISGTELTPEMFGIKIKQMELNYEKKCPAEKYVLLWQHIERESWSLERFDYAVHQLLMKHKWPVWTIADFYAVEQPTGFNHVQYLNMVHKYGESINETLECHQHIQSKQTIYVDKSHNWHPDKSIFKQIW